MPPRKPQKPRKGAPPGAKPLPPGAKPAGALPKKLQKALQPYVEEAESLSAAFIEQAEEKWATRLDRSIDSIRHLDRVVRFAEPPLEEGQVLQAGFLFGEILRRAYQGRYQWDARVNALSLQFEGALMLHPIESVRKIVADRRAPRLEDYLLVLARKISERRAGPPG